MSNAFQPCCMHFDLTTLLFVSLVTALRPLKTLVEAGVEVALVVVAAHLKSVTGAEKSATLPVRAQKPLVEAVEVAMAEEEEATVRLVAVERLGELGSSFIKLETLIALVQLFLWWCGALVP